MENELEKKVADKCSCIPHEMLGATLFCPHTLALHNKQIQEPLLQKLNIAREVLEEIRKEADRLYRKDNAEFMSLTLNESTRWDAPSRHLQTFSWLEHRCENALIDMESI